MEKIIKLTEKEQATFDLIQQVDGGFLKRYGKGWKLMAPDYSPVRLFSNSIVMKLIEKQFLKKENSEIKITSNGKYRQAN